MGWDAPWHWVVLAIIVIALFGYKKMPDAARSLGRSLRIFKTEIKGMTEDDSARNAARDASHSAGGSAANSTVDPATKPAIAPAAEDASATPSPVTTPHGTDEPSQHG